MTDPTSGGGVQRFIGLLLVIAAVLWMAFSGLCAAWMIGGMLTGGRDASVDFWGWSFLIVVVCGFSVAAGFAVFIVRQGLRR